MIELFVFFILVIPLFWSLKTQKTGRWPALIFSTTSMLLLVYLVWFFSFASDLFFGIDHIIAFGVSLLLIVQIATLLFSKKPGNLRKFYSGIALLQLLVIWSVAEPIRTWQIETSRENAIEITALLEEFNDQFGQFPTALNELEDSLQIDIPSRTNIGSKYFYEPKGDGSSFTLSFYSYYGYNAYLYSGRKDWILMD